MSTDTRTIINTTPTALGVLTTLKPISDGLQAMVTAGKLTQTADTGQVSWGGVSTSQINTTNYEIFYLNDSLHATYPLYFKFSYITGITSVVPWCTIQIGVGTDGAGNLTGSRSAAAIFRGAGTGAASTTDAVSQTIWTSCGTGYLNLWGGFSATANTSSPGGYCLSIERLRDSSGVITGDGVNVVMTTGFAATAISLYPPAAAAFSSASNNMYVQSCFAAQRSMLPGLFNTSNCVWPPVMNHGHYWYGSPMFDGTNFLASSIQPFAGKIYSPGIACMLLDPNFTALANYSFSSYSTAHNYVAVNSSHPAIIPLLAPPNILAFTVTGTSFNVQGFMLLAFLYE